jgi:hypothetical protein
MDQQTQATQKYNWGEIGSNGGVNLNWQSEAAIPCCEILDDTGQKHVEQPATNLQATTGAGTRC